MDETKKCKVVISYEDEAGKSASMEKEFPLTVTPAQNPADMMPMEAEAPEKRTSGCSDRDRGCCGGRNCYSCIAAQT